MTDKTDGKVLVLCIPDVLLRQKGEAFRGPLPLFRLWFVSNWVSPRLDLGVIRQLFPSVLSCFPGRRIPPCANLSPCSGRFRSILGRIDRTTQTWSVQGRDIRQPLGGFGTRDRKKCGMYRVLLGTLFRPHSIRFGRSGIWPCRNKRRQVAFVHTP